MEQLQTGRAAVESGDDGTNDLLVSDVLRLNELQVWFLNEQLAGSGIADEDVEAARSILQSHG
jgi:starvation-inducible DNA-binding protein